MSETIRHENVVVFDDRGIPSIMVRIERPKTEVTPAMFILGTETADAIYISKYPNKVIGGRAYSLPMVDPTVNINFDEAVQACRAKGKGWHLMTAVEWEYLLNESRQQDTLPHGNTNYGNDYYHKEEHGEFPDRSRTVGRTLTGSGPVTWNHDHTVYGVSDMCGNVWEWLAGLRIVDGVLEYIPNNNAALEDCDLSRDSKDWQQIITDAVDKDVVRVNVEYGEITITDKAAGEDYTPDYDGTPIKDLKVDLNHIPQVLRDLGIIPESRVDSEGKTYVWFDATEGEYMPFRGSAFGSTSHSGPSALFLAGVRSFSHDLVGFRSAFYEVNGKLITE